MLGGENPAYHNILVMKIHFIITGFGKFRDAPENPTTIIASKLVDYLQEQDIDGDWNSKITVTVLEVSVGAVKEFLNGLEAQLKQQQQHPISSSIVLLHLGVNYKGTGFQLEQCAYNDASFRIPDERGYQPEKVSILPELEWGKTLYTTMNVERLCKKLGSEYKCEVLSKAEAEEKSQSQDGRTQSSLKIIHSTDPGRYVCNYIYCSSLDKFCSDQNDDNANDGNKGERGPHFFSLFLHVPPFKVTPEEEQIEFVSRLVRTIEEEILEEGSL